MSHIGAKTKHTRSQHVPSTLYVTLTKRGDTPTDLVRRVYENRPHTLRSLEAAEAVFIRNNALNGGGLPAGRVVTLNPASFSDAAISHWHRNKYSIDATFRSSPDLFDFMRTTDQNIRAKMHAFVKMAEESKWTVDKHILTVAGFSANVASALAAAQKNAA